MERYQREAPMNIYEAKAIFNRDFVWLQEAGMLDFNGSWTDTYYKFMQGKLKLKPEVEINVLRRIERFAHLDNEIDYAERWIKK